MAPTVTVTRDIAAPPDAVYAAISDITRMGDWSAECIACRWHEGTDGPEVGATFDGHNRHSDREWTTQGKIVEAVPGRSFVFECSMYGVHYATWGYRIEPTDNGCRVTEWSDDLRSEKAVEFSERVSGVHDRAARNRQTMSITLDRLAAALEGSTRPTGHDE